jgi:hypothetical protein
MSIDIEGPFMTSILVPIGGAESDEVVFETALAAARPLQAHLQFLHVRIGAGAAARNTPHVAFVGGAALRDALDELESQSATRSAAAARHVREFCARANVSPATGLEKFMDWRRAGARRRAMRSSASCSMRGIAISSWWGDRGNRMACRRTCSSFCC